MSKETIFAEALSKPTPEERRQYLDAACADDTELRTEIENLLTAHADAGSFLHKTPEELLATVRSGDRDANDVHSDGWQCLLEPTDKPGCLGTLGHHEVIELVGRGGMGLVLRARDPKLNRTTAIKLLAPELAVNPMAVRRFLREAQAAAAVSHDHVVTIYAIDEQFRPPFIVMEYVDGQSLQQKIDRVGALDVKSILRIGMQTASGLAAAHRQGLVHRDIKPANILLENGIERVKLSDFGLARAVDDIGVSRTGTITGTPQYMSPEQAQGERIDHRTDLFSLGCVLYAMCAGRPAFRADSAVAVMHRVVHDQPKPVHKLNAEIPEWLCEIVERLLQKNPKDRFQSAEEVEDLLGRHLAHLQQPESVPQPPAVGPSRPRTEAHRDSAVHEQTHAGHWLRRVPISAWAALLLFLAVYLCALSEWTGLSHELGARPTGIGFYSLASFFVLAWASRAVATRLTQKPRTAETRLSPRPAQLAAFLCGVTLVTGIFVWQWAELSNWSDRERMLGFFFGHGWLTVDLRNPKTRVEFNGQPIDVPPDGRVVLRPEQPGSYMVEARNERGWLIRSESLVHHDSYPTVHVAKEATVVEVTGPIRGTFTDEPD